MTIIRQQPAPACATGWDERWRVAGLCLLLAAITFAVFGQTAGFEFINFDDGVYVSDNGRVTGGLSLKGLAWVFAHPDCSLYHPLTMVSLMADYQLHQLHAGGYHFTNVLFHTASVILLFLILLQMTGAFWRSAFVAAVFAIHPLRVESVAWVAERKDVLSGLFFMLTLGAYVRFVRKPNSLARYLMVAAAFVLALLSKPTVVTLPFVLLLLDYWPLHRFEQPRTLSRLILEKIPLLALSAGACVMTAVAAETAITAPTHVSMLSRIGNAVVSYGIYLRQMLFPAGLAIPYLIPPNGLPFWEVALIFMLLVAISISVLACRKNCPYLLVGWLWYLGMLVPVMGIVQMSFAAHADRSTYLPGIGLTLAVTWAVAEWSAGWKHREKVVGGLMVVVIGALMVCAWIQTGHWKSSETLWNHTLACNKDNDVAHGNLGNALFDKGRVDEAFAHFQMALQINPDNAGNHNNLGAALLHNGKLNEAISQFQRAVQIDPNNVRPHFSLGAALLQKGKVDEAIVQFLDALQIHPDYVEAHNSLGNALLRKGKVEEAAAQFQKALEINPDFAQAHYNLGNILLQRGRVDDAIFHYQNALQINPDYAEADVNLGSALLQKGKTDEAILHYQHALQIDTNLAPAHINLGGLLLQKGKAAEAIIQFQQALRLEPNEPEVQNSLAWLLATCQEAALRNGDEAVQLAQQANKLTGGKNPFILRTLAAAFAETGRLSEAVETAQQALRQAGAQSNPKLTEALQSELKFYQAGKPFHQK